MWIESTRATTTPSTRHTYAAHLGSVAARLGIPTPILRMYTAGLRNSGALIPQRQATPIDELQLGRLARAAFLERNGEALHTALFLAWKTASRWDDVSRLTSRQLVRISDERIVIDWSSNTKTTRADPFRHDSIVVISDEAPIPELILRTLRQLQPDTCLCPRTTDWLDRWIKQVLGATTGITAHSIKAGAIEALATFVAAGLLEPRLLSIMAKHKVENREIATTTLRYIRNRELKGDLIGTSKATILLHWSPSWISPTAQPRS
jgi:hypothetical protein